MLPTEAVEQWRQTHPWGEFRQVEQDLLLERIIHAWSRSAAADEFAMIGGTALHKLYGERQARYSEDIDLVHLGDRSVLAMVPATPD